jgi:hypothetical protein
MKDEGGRMNEVVERSSFIVQRSSFDGGLDNA